MRILPYFVTSTCITYLNLDFTKILENDYNENFLKLVKNIVLPKRRVDSIIKYV